MYNYVKKVSSWSQRFDQQKEISIYLGFFSFLASRLLIFLVKPLAFFIIKTERAEELPSRPKR